MKSTRDKYISPFTDFGFKRLFGEEVNKDLLLDFLNEVLRDKEGEIVSLQYLKSEQLGRLSENRKAIFDIYCENERGEKFIVEMQKTRQKFFKDRSVYYSTFPIQQQAEKNDWNFELKSVYTIGILDFVFDEDKDNPKFRYDVKLTDIKTNKVFFDKLTFIYFEMPKFNKTIDELETKYDKWLYVLKNLPHLQSLPSKLQEKIFLKVFDVAEISQFTREEHMHYEDSLKGYRDAKNILDTAVEEALEEGRQKGMEEGRQKGIEEGIEKVALNLLQNGIPIDIIAKTTGLTSDDIESLKQNM